MPHSRTILFLITILLSGNTFANESTDSHRGLLDSMDLTASSAELKGIAQRDPVLFAKNKYGYLLGRVEAKRGGYAEALQYFHVAAKSDPDLRPYALKHISQIMRLSGNLAFERLFLNELVFGNESKLLSEPARSRLVFNYYESEDYETVVSQLTAGIPDSESREKVSIGRDMLLLLGNSYLRSKRVSEAKRVYEQLIESIPKAGQPDDFALESAKGLDILNVGDKRFGKEVANLPAAEHKRRAAIYQFNRNFTLARLHYSAVVKNHEGNSDGPAAIYEIARGFDQERNYKESLAWYKKITSRFPANPLSANALYGIAGAYANLDDLQNTVSAYQKYIDENPDAKNLERAHLNIVDAYRDAGDNKKALEKTAEIQRIFKGEKGEAVALFFDVKIFISENNWKGAYDALKRLGEMNDLGGTSISGGTNYSEVEFLTALSLEKLKRAAEAGEIYKKISARRALYFGWRADERSKAMAPETDSNNLNNKADKTSDAAVSPTFKSFDAEISDTARILLDLGIYDEASPEIELSLRERQEKAGDELSNFDDEYAFALAELYAKGGFADRALRFVEPKLKKVFRESPIEKIPQNQMAVLYPAPFRYELVNYGKRESVDPRFLLSIMRQESRFQTDVKSAASARGLMQFISGTSRQIAEELNIKQFRNDDLYDPETAIRFGSRYLSKLFREFPEKHQAVAASYNAGEDRVARWMKRAKTSEPDQYVPEIVFIQTKDYVYKVLDNYRVYRYLYDENLVLRR